MNLPSQLTTACLTAGLLASAGVNGFAGEILKPVSHTHSLFATRTTKVTPPYVKRSAATPFPHEGEAGIYVTFIKQEAGLEGQAQWWVTGGAKHWISSWDFVPADGTRYTVNFGRCKKAGYKAPGRYSLKLPATYADTKTVLTVTYGHK